MREHLQRMEYPMSTTYSITITRFDSSVDAWPYGTTYDVPDDPEIAPMTALKALHWIIRHKEPIAYDYNCRRGTCGRCAMMIDGEPRLACLYTLTGSHSLAPLKGFPVIRDLVVDKQSAYAKFVASNHSIKTLSPNDVLKPIDGAFWRETIYPLNACRECMCCYGGCQALGELKRWGAFAGPGAMQEIYLRSIDGEDRSNRIEQAVFSGLFACIQCGNCTKYCPALIKATENIKTMMDAATEQGLKPSDDKMTNYWPML